MTRLALPILLSVTTVSAFTASQYAQNILPSNINRRCHHNPLQRTTKHVIKSFQRISTTKQSTNTDESSLSSSDIQHMKLATQTARIGYGNTYPNPAVGCVLVHHDKDSNNDVIIGSGFHPKAGMPHAEVFALLEACGHVNDGIEAAKSVMGHSQIPSSELTNQVSELLNTYKARDGASTLFADKNNLSTLDITAYVTLEPCCHVGQTPPCALSLVAAGINRVVVGFRDPNPRVDGGGIQILQDAGIEVHVLDGNSKNGQEKEAAVDCAQLVQYFVKRISPQNGFSVDMYENMNGKKKRLLRAMALRQKTDGTMASVEWLLEESMTAVDEKDIDVLHEINIDARFLESVDQCLFDHELVLLRLNSIVNKKKGAKILGERVAEMLNAHVAQVLGHTALLYRPGMPPVLDLDELVRKELDE